MENDPVRERFVGVTEYESSWASTIVEVGHFALDVGGMVPGFGAFFDLANAGLYAYEGRYWEAGQSALAAVPGFGDLAGAYKIADKTTTAGKLILGASKASRTLEIGSNVAQAGVMGYEGYQEGSGLKMGFSVLGVGMNTKAAADGIGAMRAASRARGAAASPLEAAIDASSSPHSQLRHIEPSVANAGGYCFVAGTPVMVDETLAPAQLADLAIESATNAGTDLLLPAAAMAVGVGGWWRGQRGRSRRRDEEEEESNDRLALALAFEDWDEYGDD
jgi:hypothetical protein